jgi:hypothetical protein
MHYYKLDSRESDQAFLSGLPVACKAVVREADYLTGKLSEGTHLVVVLSNGKKYKGRITTFSPEVHDGFAEGELTILKV